MDQFSYAFGVVIGQLLLQMGVKPLLNFSDFNSAVHDIFNNNQLKVESKMAEIIVNSTLSAQTGQITKEAGEKFLSQNKLESDVITTSSGLQYKVIKQGTGRKPEATSSVKCHYSGTLIDGTEFDSSYKRNQPAIFRLNQVIAGWTEGLLLMQEGSVYRFFIPYNLAYGSYGNGPTIPPYAALIFDVELISVN